MAYKFIILACVIAATQAGILQGTTITRSAIAHGAPFISSPLTAAPLAPAPLTYASAAIATAPLAAAPIARTIVADEYDSNPQYQFGYDIQDGLTGDSKNQVESRNGDVVQGSYSLNDPDGTRRIVDYTADPLNGFNAIVRKEPLLAKTVVASPVIAKVAAPVAYPSAPLAARISAPLAYPTAGIARIGNPLSYPAPGLARFGAGNIGPFAYATAPSLALH